jgi:hypothetical protein
MEKIYICCLLLATLTMNSQTENDGLMMPKKNLCVGGIYQNSHWHEYWEGMYKRENLNLGTVTTTNYNFNANYGIVDNANIILGVNYVTTKASAGTMKGQKGLQNLSLALKYKALEKTIKKSTFSLIGLAGFSVPMTDYTKDYLPLSIGMGCKEGYFKLMGDYQYGKFTTTLSGSYVHRANIKIDRDTYFTNDEYILSNEVLMPDVISNSMRVGYRSEWFIAEIAYENMITLGKTFDISKNNMPFPSNTMNLSKIGINAKYEFKKITGLALVGGYNQVLEGRNVGQSETYYGGVFYNFNFNSKK